VSPAAIAPRSEPRRRPIVAASVGWHERGSIQRRGGPSLSVPSAPPRWTRSDTGREIAPVESETCQVLAQAIRVVRRLSPRARDREERTTGFRERTCGSTDGHDVRELHAVEAVEGGQLLGTQDVVEARCVPHGSGTLPHLAQAHDLVLDDVE